MFWREGSEFSFIEKKKYFDENEKKIKKVKINLFLN